MNTIESIKNILYILDTQDDIGQYLRSIGVVATGKSDRNCPIYNYLKAHEGEYYMEVSLWGVLLTSANNKKSGVEFPTNVRKFVMEVSITKKYDYLIKNGTVE